MTANLHELRFKHAIDCVLPKVSSALTFSPSENNSGDPIENPYALKMQPLVQSGLFDEKYELERDIGMEIKWIWTHVSVCTVEQLSRPSKPAIKVACLIKSSLIVYMRMYPHSLRLLWRVVVLAKITES